MNSGSVVGQTLDSKYKIEKELGKGGMGTVYLATHVGTERPVAVKVIASEFMQRQEFIERFRREARAAGRLRHPNVVNVTDFGFAQASSGTVAYLVMEYLDGCTLGEILEEEKRLPLSWTIDILEQVCSAVEEAHRQGIIHRDLKPDNIWLEPNQRGGYTVKVLDFGIAKLEEQINDAFEFAQLNFPTTPTGNLNRNQTVAEQSPTNTLAEKRNHTFFSESATVALGKNLNAPNSEAGTLIQPLEAIDSESGTQILPASNPPLVSSEEADSIGTKILPASSENATKLISEQFETDKSLAHNSATAELTRVGAVLGTPLYMSPEQCRGEKLSPRSDVYSLGIIAYQMLAGKTPFSGDYKAVMKAHEESQPPSFEAKRVPKKIKNAINLALAKTPEQRPPTAQAFAAELRAQSEGVGTLFRRSTEIYSRHLSKFLLLALIFYSPLVLLTILQIIVSFLSENLVVLAAIKSAIAIATLFAGFTCVSLLVGTTTWLVAQILAFPLKPITLRPAVNAVKTKWKKLVGTSILLGVLEFVGFALCLIPGVFLSVIWALASAVVMMENLHGFKALKRSKILVKRSFRTTFAVTLITFFIPMIISLSLAYFARLAVQDVSSKAAKIVAVKQALFDDSENKSESKPEIALTDDAPKTAEPKAEDNDIQIKIGPDKNIEINNSADSKDRNFKLKSALSEALQQIIFLPISILLVSFFSVVSALLYFKSRRAGGESMQELLEQFQETDRPQSNWQKRIRERIEQSGKQTSNS